MIVEVRGPVSQDDHLFFFVKVTENPFLLIVVSDEFHWL